jgi:MoaA/NifB/PqqE/SkfB family radical SAM enzyme
MCDIWKGNANTKQLTEQDVAALLSSLKKLGTQRVVMSGGEALLNPNLFKLCALLKKENIKITLLSSGIALKNFAEQIVAHIDDVIISLDGNEIIHNQIRNIPTAFTKLAEGVASLKVLNKNFRITARTVVQKINFFALNDIVTTAQSLGLQQISFLPVDVSTTAFNRPDLLTEDQQRGIAVCRNELPELKIVIQKLIKEQADKIGNFIAEDAAKLMNIYFYYAALHGLNAFPYKKCNAPWVSAVVEADGTVRPCFFHEAYGNIHKQSFNEIINSANAVNFRKNLNIERSITCMQCVCSLNLPPTKAIN